MAVESSSCKDCTHFKVCSLKGIYKESVEQACRVEVPEPFKLVLTHFNYRDLAKEVRP